MRSFLQLIFYVCDLLFDFWPLLLLSPLQSRKNFIRNLAYSWFFWATIRILLFLNPEPFSSSLFIPEPRSTLLFFITGLLVLLLWIGQKYWIRNQIRRKFLGIRSSEDLLDLPPGILEEMVAEIYREFGHQAKRTGTRGDHGVDVVVKAKNGQKWIAQCKRWRKPVGESIVRDFYGTMHHEKAAQGAIIATCGFTQQASDWAKGKPLKLYNGEDFIEVWKRAQSKTHKKKNSD